MGQTGPVPKRSTQRRRTNKESRPEIVRATGQVEVPAADADWHEIAKGWYEALAASGQARFFEPSDWQAARFVAEAMTTNLNAGRFSAQLFAAVWSAMGDLLTTEGDRRRARLEIERLGDKPEPDGVTSLDDFRSRAA